MLSFLSKRAYRVVLYACFCCSVLFRPPSRGSEHCRRRSPRLAGLAEIAHAEYRDAKELSNVFSTDFAPALGILLDAHLGNCDTVSRPALVRSAASCGGLACLQLLHERCSRDDWSQLLTRVPGIVRESPLASAFGACESGAFEYLLSFHSPSGADGPDLLSHEAVNSALAILAEHAPEQALPLQARLDGLRRVGRAHADRDGPRT
jgi:hypothetical protein